MAARRFVRGAGIVIATSRKIRYGSSSQKLECVKGLTQYLENTTFVNRSSSLPLLSTSRLLIVHTISRRARRANFARTLAIATLCAASACLPTPSDPTGVTPLEGRWDVTGQFSSGAGGSFQGTMSVQSTSASGFAGTYDVLEGAPQGQQRRLSGPVGGRMASATTTEFDVTLNGNTRRHVASHSADTLRGSWFDVTTAGTVEASGSFRAIRRP